MHSIAKIDEHRRSDKDMNRTINKLMESTLQLGPDSSLPRTQ